MAGVNGAAPVVDLARMEPRSILVVRFKALGDIVLSLPIVRALRARFPRATIRYLCRPAYAEALAGVRELDGVLRLPAGALDEARFALRLRSERIDCAIDLLGSPRSAVLTLLAGARARVGMRTRRHDWCYTHHLPRALYRDGERIMTYTLLSNRALARMLGLDPGPERLDIGFPAADPEIPWALERAREIRGTRSRLVGLVPGALYQAKSWPEERFVELANGLRDRMDAAVAVLWGPGERALAGRIAAAAPGAAIAPEMGIARLGAFIGSLDCLAGIDSGPKHLAVVQGVPTVTVFGPTDPRTWDPMTERHRAVHLGLDCFPCKKPSCAPNRCMTEIAAGRVLDEIERALAAPPPREA